MPHPGRKADDPRPVSGGRRQWRARAGTAARAGPRKSHCRDAEGGHAAARLRTCPNRPRRHSACRDSRALRGCHQCCRQRNGRQTDATVGEHKSSRAIAHAAKDAGVPRLVQVSSFSILGAAEHIDDRTVERPINAYGRSKAAAEHVLLGNSDDAFSVECVRLPFLFSAAKPSLLAPLLSLATRLRHLPAASGHPVRRSMITYADAARQLANAARSGTGGISFAADPRLFDYDLLGVVLVEEARMRLRIVSLPRIVVAGADRLFPAIGRRLFRSSVLDPRANRAGNQPLGLEDELRKLVRSTYGS